MDDTGPESDAPTLPGRAPPPPMGTIVELGKEVRAKIDALAGWYGATFDEALGLVLRFGLGAEEGKLALGEAFDALVEGDANPDERTLVLRIDALATRRGITVAEAHAILVRSGLARLADAVRGSTDDRATMDELCAVWPGLRAHAAPAGWIRLDEEIITRIDALAKRRGVTREDVLRRLLEQPGSEERGEDAGEPPETAR
jgi:hypothetical protein